MPKVIVIGAGAAGLMAASFAATAGAETVLVERTRDGGRKILISGGGRCNVLPARVDESRFVTDSSPNLLRKMVRAWPLAQQRAFFEETLGIALEEETVSAKLFPASHRARDVRDGLLAHARAVGVQLLMETRITGIAPSATGWEVTTELGETLRGDAVIVATGGLSVPNTGSDGAGLEMLAALGHAMHTTYAALTPVTADAPAFSALAGVSLTVSLTARSAARSATARGGFLFTHRGYSGPSVLDVSHVLVRARAEQAAATLQVQWTPWGDAEWEAALKPHGARSVTGALRAQLPDRLAAVLLDAAAVDATRALSELRRDERRRLIDVLVRGTLPWDGDEGYKKAEVTGGGVALGEVHPQTMESRRHRGLFLCGEVLDAFGPIGGYNFLWAWATGRAAGLGAAGRAGIAVTAAG
ncbi:MAG: aminoacetone oxidase family FAD-binding enzyme [Gemmatimonadaceae bacterium]|nr:aminoacetone oxidase family FAD-binding enzyme [Gemmatimonadaceae bacterium]